MNPRMPPQSEASPRRRRLTVVVHDIEPPHPAVGEEVGVILDGEHAIKGWVLNRLTFDSFRIELDPEAVL